MVMGNYILVNKDQQEFLKELCGTLEISLDDLFYLRGLNEKTNKSNELIVKAINALSENYAELARQINNLGQAFEELNQRLTSLETGGDYD